MLNKHSAQTVRPSSTDAVVVTYKRPTELRRLIESLRQGSVIPRQVLVVDNSPDEEAAGVCREFPNFCRHVSVGRNAGVGAGFNIGLQALSDDPPQFVCALDDDCVVSRDALRSLLGCYVEYPDAGFAAPLVRDGEGAPIGRPGFTRKADRRTFDADSPSMPLSPLHGAPLRWATGICLLCRYSDAIRVGGYREDFWALGEDVELTLRLSQKSWGRMADGEVSHLPPIKDRSSSTDSRVAYVKFLALITNISFFAVHLPHGRREIASIPKTAWRFLASAPRFSGASPLRDVTSAVWIGAAERSPAGSERFAEAFKRRYIPGF